MLEKPNSLFLCYLLLRVICQKDEVQTRKEIARIRIFKRNSFYIIHITHYI